MTKNLDALILPPLQSLAERIKNQHKRAGLVGNSIRSVEVKKSGTGYQIEVDDSLSELSEKLKAGAKPSTLTEIIAEYAKDKGIDLKSFASNGASPYSPEERGLRNLAYLLSEELKEKGTTLDDLLNGKTTFDSDAQKTLDEIADNLLDHYQQQVIDDLDRILKK